MRVTHIPVRESSHSRADRSGSPLQPGVHLLQRIRQARCAGGAGDHARAHRPPGSAGTANIEISGGEPLLHPELDELIWHIRGTGALDGLITNGYLLNEARIERFNNVGLDHLQISIDNVTPDNIEEEPESARREAEDAGEARRV